MAKSLASLRTVRAENPPLFVAYGVHGWGKTSLAAEWPDPVFVQCEQGTPGGAELQSFGEIETFGDVLDSIGALLTEDHDRKTLVVDSIDAMEPLIWRHVCEENGWPNIEAPGFGKGYILVDSAWIDFLSGCKALNAAGIAVVLIGHSEVVRFDSPTTDPYSRYGLKLHKRGAALVQEKADVVAFCGYRVAVKEKDVGFKKMVSHAEGGGTRVMHLEERPGFHAKNRYTMPPSLDFAPGKGFSVLSPYFPNPTGKN